MTNQYLKNLNKMEFVVTDACTGKCKHCSQGEHNSRTEIDPLAAAEAVRRVAGRYDIKTVMAFGGEPLLRPDAVCEIISAAKEMNIKTRQVITNGCFSRDVTVMAKTADKLAKSGVNDLVLSADAFHQEALPLDIVATFANEARRCDIPIRIQPAWLVSREHVNPYNARTRKILNFFNDLGFALGDGNVIFPEGNAARNLAEYFLNDAPKNPYIEDERDVRCLSFCANGDVLNGNIYKSDIIDIINSYKP